MSFGDVLYPSLCAILTADRVSGGQGSARMVYLYSSAWGFGRCLFYWEGIAKT